MMTRREFFRVLTKSLVVLWGFAILYPVARYLKRPKSAEEEAGTSVVVCKTSEIAPGQSKSFKYGNHPGLLICDEAGQYHAFDATCTHLGCTAQYRSKEKDIFCACHEGVYSLDGKNVSGPPPKPLLALKIAVKNGDIVVSQG